MALRGFIGFLLVLAIAFSFSSYMFFYLTEHDAGQQFFSKMIADRIEKEASAEDFAQAERYVRFECKDKGVAYLNITAEPLKINCTQMDKVPFNILLGNAIYDKIYYKSYDCGLIDCFFSTQNIPALIAGQSHDRYWSYYLYLLAIDIVLAILLFFVSEGWTKKASSFGYVLLVSGLGAFPFFVTQKLFNANMQFMNNIIYAQIIMLAIGIVLLVVSIIIKSKRKKKKNEDDEEESGNEDEEEG